MSDRETPSAIEAQGAYAEYLRRAEKVRLLTERSAQLERDFLETKVLNEEANDAMEAVIQAKKDFSYWLLNNHERLVRDMPSSVAPTVEQREKLTALIKRLREEPQSRGVGNIFALCDAVEYMLGNAHPEAYATRPSTEASGDMVECLSQLRRLVEAVEAWDDDDSPEGPDDLTMIEAAVKARQFLDLRRETPPTTAPSEDLAFWRHSPGGGSSIMDHAPSSTVGAPVVGECEDCGHAIVTPLKRLVTESMVETALDAARAFLAPRYVIDVRSSWTETDRGATRAMLEAVINEGGPEHAPRSSNVHDHYRKEV